jgi:phage gpG-like protein
MDVSLSVDLRDVEKGIDAMVNPRAIARGLRELKKPLRVDQREHAKKSEGPEGRWPKRATKSRKRLLGRLPGTVKVTSSGNSVSAVSGVKWSAVHQEGGTAGHGVKIPARPFLWISATLYSKAVELLGEAVAKEW